MKIKMKKGIIVMLGMSLFFYSSCLKQNNQATSTGSISFLDSTYGVRNIFDAKCAKCHASGAKDAEEWLYDNNDYERSIKKNIEEIFKVTKTTTAKMATSKYGNLLQEEVDKINQWYKAGYPTQNAGVKIAFTYSVMKNWFDVECASCHAVGKSNAASWLYDASDYNLSFKNNVSTLKNVILTKKTMPPGKTLTSAEIEKLSQWFDAEAPATN